jgi:hypothetical protein
MNYIDHARSHVTDETLPVTERAFLRMALDALPAGTGDRDDWGSDRQCDAENAFFVLVNHMLTDEAQRQQLADYCLKATCEEMIEHALRVVSNPLATARVEIIPLVEKNRALIEEAAGLDFDDLSETVETLRIYHFTHNGDEAQLYIEQWKADSEAAIKHNGIYNACMFNLEKTSHDLRAVEDWLWDQAKPELEV